MEESVGFKWEEPVSLLAIKKIGIIYCASAISAVGREIEKLADCEIVDVAKAVQVALRMEGYDVEMVNLDPERIGDLGRFDWIFNLTETIYGFPLTDYEIASKLEELKIPFTGSGSRTLRTCLDKAATKYELLRYRIETPAFEVFQPGQTVLTALTYPLFVKPIHEDGSFGIDNHSIVRNDVELRRQVVNIHQKYNQAALVEQYIDGRDITASIIGNGEQELVLPLSEITYNQNAVPKFQTFNVKWMNDSADCKAVAAQCPCDISRQLEVLIKDTALRTYHALGCRDYARVDFRLQGESCFVLDVNPNPCINPEDSGFVRCGKVAGYSYADLVMKILENAVNNYLSPVDARVALPEYSMGN